MKIEKWTVTIQNDEMRVPYISEENTSFIESLAQRWITMGQGLWEDEFNLDEFKCLLRDTVPALAEYVNMVVPIQVVSLLLAINEFQNCPEIDQESGVAIRIASDLCDAENFCNINYDEDRRMYISVCGNNDDFDIYMDDLDFSELISDLDS